MIWEVLALIYIISMVGVIIYVHYPRYFTWSFIVRCFRRIGKQIAHILWGGFVLGIKLITLVGGLCGKTKDR